MTDPIRAALERLVARLDETTDPNGPVPAWSDSFLSARAALSADGPAVPEGREPAAVVTEPSDAELESFLLDVAAEHGDIYWAEPLVLARAVLARWGHPAPQPPSRGGGAAMSWQPIDTAPKDGTEILASDYDAIEIVSWVEPRFNLIPGDWVGRDGCVMFPAWWQPLPDHPPLPTTEAQP